MSCFSKISENNNEIVYDENVDKRSDHTCVCYVGVVLFSGNFLPDYGNMGKWCGEETFSERVGRGERITSSGFGCREA